MEGGCLLRPLKPKDIENLSPYSDYFGNKACSLIKFDCPKCKNCECDMTFIMQLYCPLNDDMSRTLYIFVCMGYECLLSNPCYRLLRVQQKITKASEIKPIIEETGWGFSSPSPVAAKRPEIVDILKEEHESFVIESPCLAKGYFVDFYQNEYAGEYQLDSDDEELEHDNELVQYLSSDSHHSKEVVLYQRGGNPVVSRASSLSLASALQCRNCAAPLAFEAQIFPNINNFLSSGDEWPLAFDNALLYTCSRSCGDVVEEEIVIESSTNKIM